MRLLKRAATVACIAMLSLLAGCVTTYLPPVAGATATLNVTVVNSVGLGRLDIVPPGASEKLILKNLYNPIGASTQTIVPADQSAQLIYFETTGNSYCTLRIEFTPEAGQTYNIYAGDRKPPAANGFFSRLADGGAECVAAANQVLPDGSLMPVTLTRWSVF